MSTFVLLLTLLFPPSTVATDSSTVMPEAETAPMRYRGIEALLAKFEAEGAPQNL
jgi:hypothetical protein